MVEKSDLRDIEMSYPLKMNRLLRGSFVSPCPDCITPHPAEIADCDEWCLRRCSFQIDRSILSERQKKIHDQRRSDTLHDAIRMLEYLRGNSEITDDEFQSRMNEIVERLKKQE